MKQLFVLSLIVSSMGTFMISATFAHGVIPTDLYPKEERAIEFPDTEHFLTLVLDPHTHSVFSDGHVWPNARVAEAIRDASMLSQLQRT